GDPGRARPTQPLRPPADALGSEHGTRLLRGPRRRRAGPGGLPRSRMAPAARPGPLRRPAHALAAPGPRMGGRELRAMALPPRRAEDGAPGRRGEVGAPVPRAAPPPGGSLRAGRPRRRPRHDTLAGRRGEPAHRPVAHPPPRRPEALAPAVPEPALLAR